MASTDYPFSITAKYSVQGGSEHLVTVRAGTSVDMEKRLVEAAALFPNAHFDDFQLEREPDVAPYADEVNPPLTPPQAVGNPVRDTEPHATANAQARSAAASAARKDNGNGNRHTPLCPQHGRSARSRFGPPGGLYCPTQLDDGSYCRWSWPPEPVAANVN